MLEKDYICNKKYKLTTALDENILCNFSLIKRNYYDNFINLRPHFHAFYEIMCITSGKGLLQTDSIDFPANSGDVFIFNSKESHNLKTKSRNSTLEIISISFPARFIWSPGIEQSELSYLKVFDKAGDKYKTRLEASNQNALKIKTVFYEILYEFETQNPGFELAVKLKLLNILLILIRKCNYVSTNNYKIQNTQNFKLIEQSMLYINNNLDYPHTLEELANSCHMSVSYYSKLFKLMNGVTPWNYIIEKRLEAAIFMIFNDNLNISQIAIKSGFNDISNFNKVFKKYLHKSPREFKSSIKKQGDN